MNDEEGNHPRNRKESLPQTLVFSLFQNSFCVGIAAVIYSISPVLCAR